MITTLPWHQQILAKLLKAKDQLHHGLLITGISGIGKREFSTELVQSLLCTEQNTRGEGMNGKACGQCQNCTLFNAGTHPDFHTLITEEETVNGRIELLGKYSERYQDSSARGKKVNPGKVIPVDQVRTLIDRMHQSAHISTAKVALILPADRMNANAANALLKLLEEPPENSYLVLVTEHAGILPATIRSRCVLHSLPPPDNATSITWLNQQTGVENGDQLIVGATTGPLDIVADQNNGQSQLKQENLTKVLALISQRQDPIELAAALAKQEPLSLLGWLQKLSCDLIRWQTADIQPSWAGQIHKQPDAIAPTNLHGLYDKIGQYRNMARDQLNIQLALEELFIQMQRLFR